jgi:hypothetical protein
LLVQALAQKGSLEARVAAGEILLRFADAIQATGRIAERGIERYLAELRFQSQRLRRAESTTFGTARWIKGGLAAALDGLEATYTGNCTALEPWAQAARQSVEAIDARSALTFQRAAIQDAFRTVSDAFVVAANPRCS